MIDASVVIATRDRPDMLGLTLRSIVAQVGLALEVLVVDDGEDATTAAVVERAGDARVRVVPNTGTRGVSGARNTGISAATGRWIAFCDDDDLWAPDKLTAQLAAAERTGTGWVYAGDVTVDGSLRVIGGGPPPRPDDVVVRLRRHNAVPAGASNVVVRREVLDTAGRFDPALRTSEDWDLWLRLAVTGTPACVSRPLVALRTHAAMASRDVDQMLADVEVIADRHRIPVDRARHERWAAWMCLEDGRRATAVHHYLRAVARGDVASVGRAAAALLNPWVARRSPADPEDDWVREAQTWLETLRDVASPSHPDTDRQPR